MTAYIIESRAAALLGAVVLPYSLAVWLALERFGSSPIESYLNYGLIVLTSWILLAALYSPFYLADLGLKRRPARPLLTFFSDLSALFRLESLLVRLLPGVLITLLLGSFTSFKSLIPALNPFQYDRLFMEMDRALFLGVDPWRATHAVFDGPIATWILQQFYISWFVLIWLSVAYVSLYSGLRQFRAHYLLAFSLTWILVGSVSALWLSSAGPCYYGWATGENDVFAPLMERLRAQDQTLRAMSPTLSLNGLLLQEYLKTAHESGRIVLGGGISAMPSMHVALAVLLGVAAYSYKRWLGWVLAPVALVIWIGSIHLGWHYAVDGLVSLILTLAIWRASGALVARFATRN